MTGIETMLQDESVVFLVKTGIVLWSLLCVAAAMRNDGNILNNIIVISACQFFLVMVGLFIITIAQTVLIRIIGMAIGITAILSAIMRRDNFQKTRYCIVTGALLATFSLLLF